MRVFNGESSSLTNLYGDKSVNEKFFSDVDLRSNTTLVLVSNVKTGDVIVRKQSDGSNTLETVKSISFIKFGRERKITTEFDGVVHHFSNKKMKMVRILAR